MEHYGIRGIPLQLIQNYLSNRQQCVNINGVLSSLLNVEIEVPQGSVLGPLLFIIYINDLSGASNLVTKLIADDTCLLFSADSVAELQRIANHEIQKIENWLICNKLSINYSKINYMIIDRKKEIFHLLAST